MNFKKFSDEVKSLTKGNETNNQMIWRSLQGEEGQGNAYFLCVQLFELLVNSQKKGVVYENEEKILSTLLVLQFYKNKKQKNEKTIEEYKKMLDQRKNKIYGHGVMVVLLFLLSTEQMQFPQNLISRYVFAPRFLNWKMDPTQQFEDKLDQSLIYVHQLEIHQSEKFYASVKKISYPENTCIEAKVLSFSEVCLHDYIRISHNQVKKSIFDHLLQLLRGHMIGLRQTNRTQPYVIFLLKFIQNIITFYGCQFPQILKDMMFFFNQLRNHPGFIGQLAYENFHLVHNELKSPGISFRKKLRSDFPALDIKERRTLNKEFYLITNKDDVFSCLQHCSLITLRKLIILQIIKGCEFENLTPFLELLNEANEEVTFQIYYKIQKILDITASLQVYDKILKIQKKSITELFSYIHEVLEKQEKSDSKPDFKERQLEQLLNKKHKLGIFDYPIYEIVHIPITTFISNKKSYCFSHIIQKNQQIQLNFYKNKVPLIFFGTDEEFLPVFTTISSFLQKSDIQDSRLLKIYYIPSPQSSSSIATYLSMKDLWYRRFVYQPFYHKMIFPHVDLSERTKDLFPTYIYNKLIHSYLKEGKRTLPIRVYKCKLKQLNQDIQQIYFYSYICLGTTAEAEIIRFHKQQDKEKIKKYSQMDYIQLLTTKIKKIQSTVLNIQLTEINSFTKGVETKVEKNLKVEQMTICNLPRDYFFGNKPNPSASPLEVAMLTETLGKVFRKEIVNKQNFKNQNESSLKETVQAFKDCFILSSVLGMKIQASNLANKELMKVVIDGVIYQKVEKMMIEEVFNVNGIPVTLPIQCFLPFN